MQTTKIFLMAALALMTVACSNDDNDIQTPAEQPANNMITITAKLAPKSSSAQTRAMNESGGNIVVDWAQNEQLQIISANGHTATANIDNVTSGVATISFAIDAAAVGQNCTIVYPASAATTTGVKSYADNAALTAQDGTLKYDIDVRVGAGTISASNPGTMTVTTQPEAQYSIFKFTLQDLSDAAKSATEFKVSDNSGNVITTVTPTSASSELYVALPVMAVGTYWFNATINSKPYIAKATTAAATVAGKYYQTTVKMATIGDVILSDGKFAARTSTTGTNVAMIAYLGSETDHATYKHGLALALTDEASTMSWTDATGASSGAAAHTPAAPTSMTSSWMLPSKDQWNKMINACKNVLGTKNNYQDLRDGFSGITDASNLQSGYYWSSTEYDSYDAWYYDFDDGYLDSIGKGFDGLVRSCLAF